MSAKLWGHLDYSQKSFAYFIKDFSLYLIISLTATFVTFTLSLLVFKSKIKDQKKKLIIITLVSVLIVIAVFSLFEAYFRYVYDASDGLGFLKVNQRWHQRHVVYNGDFMRDDEFISGEKNQTARVAVLGDSITFGGGIENPKDRFSDILEEKLKAAGYKIEVYNLGKPGADTELEIQTYNQFKFIEFDIVIWQYFLNDIQRFEKSTGTPIISRNSQQAKIAQYLSNKSFFFDYLYWRFSARYNKTFRELRNADISLYRQEETLAKHFEETASFLNGAKSEDRQVIVIIFPFIYYLGPNYPAVDIHQLLTEHFEENGASVVDLLADLGDKDAKGLWASPFDSHPNEFVHQIAAQRLYEKIVPLLQE